MTRSDPGPDPSEQPGSTPVDRGAHGEVGSNDDAFGGYGRLDTKHIARGVISEVFELDLPIIRTVIDLTIKPGKACRDYISGDRRKYTNPVKYCVLATALYVLVLVFFEVDLPGTQNVVTTGTQEAIDWTNAIQPKITSFLRGNMNFLILASIPGTALVTRVMFRKSALNYAENLAFHMFITAQVSIIEMLGAPFGLLANALMVGLWNLAGFAYFVWAATVFFQLPLWATIWRAFVSQVLFLVVTGIVATIATLAFVFIPFIVENGFPAAPNG